MGSAIFSRSPVPIFRFSLQVRKFRTLTELIMDAEEHVKNPYKGKKLKVGAGLLKEGVCKKSFCLKGVEGALKLITQSLPPSLLINGPVDSHSSYI